MNYLVDFATKRNEINFDKPNEDCAFVDKDNGIFIVLDGVTRDRIDGMYPYPSPAIEASKVFIKKAYSCIMNNFSEEKDFLKIIKRAFIEGNMEIKKLNHSYLGDFLPGTVGIIAIIRRNKLFYGYIGDCIGVLLNEKKREEFTSCQTKLIHEHAKDFTAFEIRCDICNHLSHPYSYGVLDGRDSAIDFVVTGTSDLDEYKEMILATDGLECIVKYMPANELLLLSAKDLLNNKFYNISADDKTVIIVRITSDENNSKYS